MGMRRRAGREMGGKGQVGVWEEGGQVGVWEEGGQLGGWEEGGQVDVSWPNISCPDISWPDTCVC
jgi:hypothetical protein